MISTFGFFCNVLHKVGIISSDVSDLMPLSMLRISELQMACSLSGEILPSELVPAELIVKRLSYR